MVTKSPSILVQSYNTIQNTPSAQTFNVIVNGVSFQVSGQAKNVNISKDGIEVKF
jgi:hypothetical protein